jgi:hypothetical protein
MLPGSSRLSRETRLLLITLAVSVVMLLLLARFRFPDERGVPTLVDRPPAAPLERLAARATYDELASIIADLERRIVPAIVVLRLETGEPSRHAVTGLPVAREPGSRFVPAVRVRPDAVLVMVELGASVMDIVGSDARPEVEAYDPVRGLAIVRVPPIADSPPGIWDVAPTRSLNGRYVAIVEGTLGGPTLRPTFLGRADPVSDLRWESRLLVLGGALQAPPGSLVFSLDARLVGMSVLEDGYLAVVPATALLTAVSTLADGAPPPPGDIGVEVQPLTPSLAAATGASNGVVVAYVGPRGPADGQLTFGDVVDAIDGQPVTTPRTFGILVGRAAPGSSITVRIVRGGETQEHTVTVGSSAAVHTGNAAPGLGLELLARSGGGIEVLSVAPGSAADRAGVLAGDVITRIGDLPRPSPADARRLYTQLASDAWLLVGITRGDRRMVVALSKP